MFLSSIKYSSFSYEEKKFNALLSATKHFTIFRVFTKYQQHLNFNSHQKNYANECSMLFLIFLIFLREILY